MMLINGSGNKFVKVAQYMSSVLEGDVLSVEREREAYRGGRSIERERVEREIPRWGGRN